MFCVLCVVSFTWSTPHMNTSVAPQSNPHFVREQNTPPLLVGPVSVTPTPLHFFWRTWDFMSNFFAAALPEYPRLRNTLRIVVSQTVSFAKKLLNRTRRLSGLTKKSFSSHRTINLSLHLLILRGFPVGFRGSKLPFFDITIVNHSRGRSTF